MDANKSGGGVEIFASNDMEHGNCARKSKRYTEQGSKLYKRCWLNYLSWFFVLTDTAIDFQVFY